MKKLIIIPAYNEESCIASFLRKLKNNCYGFDVLVINDGSQDETSNICREEGFEVLDLPINLGIGGAVQTGYRYGVKNGYDVVVQMDGDGQHDPEYVQHLVAPILAGDVDMVIGSRFIIKEGYQSSCWRRVGIRFYSALIKYLTGRKIFDPTSGYRAVSQEIVKYFAQTYPVDYPEPETIVSLLRLNFRIAELPVTMRKRIGGNSSIKGMEILYYMIKVTLATIMVNYRYRKIRKNNPEHGKEWVINDYDPYKTTNFSTHNSVEY